MNHWLQRNELVTKVLVRAFGKDAPSEVGILTKKLRIVRVPLFKYKYKRDQTKDIKDMVAIRFGHGHIEAVRLE